MRFGMSHGSEPAAVDLWRYQRFLFEPPKRVCNHCCLLLSM
jgi:hypothetical protein